MAGVACYSLGFSLSALNTLAYSDTQALFLSIFYMAGIVLMLEALAQAAALLSFDTLDAAPDENTVYYFAGIDGARFKRPVEPGDQLTLEVQLDRMKAGIFKFKAQAKVGDELACEAELMCTMRKIA